MDMLLDAIVLSCRALQGVGESDPVYLAMECSRKIVDMLLDVIVLSCRALLLRYHVY